MTNPRYANGHARRQLREWLRAQGLPCHICGRAIDYTLPARHPMSFEVDEVVPVSKGGSPLDRANVAPAHRICNERRGNRDMAALRKSAGKGQAAPSAHSVPAHEGKRAVSGVQCASPSDIDAAIRDRFGPRCCDLSTEDASRF